MAEFLRLRNLLQLEWKHFKMNFFFLLLILLFIVGDGRGLGGGIFLSLTLSLSCSRALQLMNYTQGCMFRISDILYFTKWERNLITTVFPKSHFHICPNQTAILFYSFIPSQWTAKLMRNILSLTTVTVFFFTFHFTSVRQKEDGGEGGGDLIQRRICTSACSLL